jgi:hypothetical protein
MSAFCNGAASLFMPTDDLVPPMGSDASSPSESQLPAIRGAVTAMVEDLSTSDVHEHHQLTEVVS